MENKKSKKKVLLYYLILAACLLVIAAVTVTIVLTVGRNSTPTLSDGSQTEKPDDGNNPNGGNHDGNNPNGGNTPDDGKKPDDNHPTGGDLTCGLPLQNASVSCGYEFAYDKTLDRYAVHQGMDFKGSAGDNVVAVLDGTIVKVVTDHILGENYVTIAHNGGLTSTYKYINAREGLKEGDSVKKGDVIGTIAEARGMEMNEGEHLHFEMAVNGKTVDPDTYLEIIEK